MKKIGEKIEIGDVVKNLAGQYITALSAKGIKGNPCDQCVGCTDPNKYVGECHGNVIFVELNNWK